MARTAAILRERAIDQQRGDAKPAGGVVRWEHAPQLFRLNPSLFLADSSWLLALCSPRDHLATFEWFIDGLDGIILALGWNDCHCVWDIE